MNATPIPPIWLQPVPGVPGRFHLPLALRLALKRAGMARVLRLETGGAHDGTAPAESEAVPLVFRGQNGASLGTGMVLPGVPAAAFLPRGTTQISTLNDTGPGLRLGLYPAGKVGLKLHAVATGRFPGLGPAARWKAAGAAARDLRGTLAALVEASPAKTALDALRYADYRASYVEDFTTVLPPEAAPRLSFLSSLGTLALPALARCATAIAGQTDPAFEWILAVPQARLEAEGEALARIAGPTARLIGVAADPEAEVSSELPRALSAALSAAQAELICLLDPAGRPTRDAVAMLRAAFADPGCAFAYTDEERLDADGIPLAGIFKPAFNRHLLHASFYVGHLFAMRRADALRLGFAPQAGPAAPFDLVLRHLAGLENRRIRHVPRVAYGAPGTRPGFAAEAIAASASVLARHLGVPVETVAERHLRPLFPRPAPAPLVSIVVPTRDRAGLLGMALHSLIATTSYRNFELIIVDNGSVEPETFALFEAIAALWPRTRVVRDDGDFNFPRICNAGVAAAQGDLILLLNNDIEVVDGDWLDEMVALAMQPGTGIVGARLLFPDRTVQHGGVIVGLFRYADHWFAHSVAEAPGYEDRLRVRQNLSAVTGACLLVRRSVWEEIGPLDEVRFAEDCNDIDLCLRARAAGHEVVLTPFTGLVHHESASRGKKRSKAHRARLKAQRARMEALWHTSAFVDPHYNPNLSRRNLFAVLAPAPEGGRDPRTDAVRGTTRRPPGASGDSI